MTSPLAAHYVRHATKPMKSTCTIAAAALLLFTPSAAQLQIAPLPPGSPAGFSSFFSKYVDVLGVGVYATPSCANGKVLHSAGVLAQYLDNDEDGIADNQAVLQKIIQLDGALIMFGCWQEFENSGFENQVPGSSLNYKQLHLACEAFPNGVQQQQFDITLEEALHLVTWAGYSNAFPAVFGEFPGSQIAQAMQASKAAGFYNPFFNEPGMPFPDQVTEYHYWGLTSILGAQNYPWRIPEIQGEWKLWSEALVQQGDPALHALLTDPQWGFASVLPDGNYDPGTPPSCPDPAVLGAGAGGANVGALSTSSSIAPGATVQLDISGLSGSSACLVLLSTSQQSLSILGGTIFIDYQNPVFTLSVALLGGAGSAFFSVPGNPALIGLHGYVQAGAVSSSQPSGWAFTNGLDLTICSG